MRVLLDPYLMMVPPARCGRKRAGAYLESLEEWMVNDFPNLVEVIHSSECTYQLVEERRFPFFSDLAKIITESGIHGYDARDISVLVNGIFESLGEIEEYLPVVYPLSNLSIVPDNIVSRLPAEVSRRFCGCLSKIALKRISADLLSISEMGHFLNRTLWHNQAALASSLRPRL